MKLSRFLLVVFVVVCMVSTVQAQRRRAVRHPGPPLSVPMVVSVNCSAVDNGHPSCAIHAISLFPFITEGRLFGSFQKPGENSFTALPGRDILWIGDLPANSYIAFQLWNGVLADGGDKTIAADPNPKFWLSGVATFKVEITLPNGVRTWAVASVSAPDGLSVGGPIDKLDVSPDGRTFFLTTNGPFNAPTAFLVGAGTVSVTGNRIDVPKNAYVGKDLLLVICAEYPVTRCSTFNVDVGAAP